MYTEDFSIGKLIKDCEGNNSTDAHEFLIEKLKFLEGLSMKKGSVYKQRQEEVIDLCHFIKSFIWYYYTMDRKSRPNIEAYSFVSIEILADIIDNS